MMKCMHCGKNEATFYYKSNINGHVTEQHLCGECAEKLGYTDRVRQTWRGGFFDDDWFSRPFGMLQPFFGGLGSRLLTEFPRPVDVVEQARSGEGQEERDDLLPKEQREALSLERKKNALRHRLHDAVAEERYEDAAKLRDELKALSA